MDKKLELKGVITKCNPEDVGEKLDPTGNYTVHSVPKGVFEAVKQLFGNYVFTRKRQGVYLIKTHIGQRASIKKYLLINLP